MRRLALPPGAVHHAPEVRPGIPGMNGVELDARVVQRSRVQEPCRVFVDESGFVEESLGRFAVDRRDAAREGDDVAHGSAFPGVHPTFGISSDAARSHSTSLSSNGTRINDPWPSSCEMLIPCFLQ